MTDHDFMKRALALAEKGRGKTSPNPMVGCVIVRSGKIISEGWHKRFGGPHAEIEALKKIPSRSGKLTMYVTLEPCHSFGKTPPCVDSVIQSPVDEVVIAMKDPNPLTNGRSIAKLKRAGKKVRLGILKKEAVRLNESFVKYIKTGLPFVTVKIAQTLDGKIATMTGDSKWITSEKTRKYTRALRDQYDAILVGINTILKDDPRLTGTKQKSRLKKIILDSKLKISAKASVLQQGTASSCIIATTAQAGPKKIQTLKQAGAEIIVCPQKKERINLEWLFKLFVQKGMINILIEGGAQVTGAALKAGLVDKVEMYIAPKIIGDAQAISAVDGLNLRSIDQSLWIENLKVRSINQEIGVSGYVFRNR